MSLTTIIIFFILLGILVLAHEFGHFFVAVRNGIKAEEFGFGFPPRFLGIVKDGKTGKRHIVLGDDDISSDHTIYSLNWIPFGGFVRMKGEDENALVEPDSFASKSALIKVAVLAAGVSMNVLLAWMLMSWLFFSGVPQPIPEGDRSDVKDISVQIYSVDKGSPAESMGIRPGDKMIAIEGVAVSGTEEAQALVSANLGKEIAIIIERAGRSSTLRGTPRLDAPQGEGALGISFAETGTVRYPWYAALVRGAQATWGIAVSVISALVGMVAGLFSGHQAVDVTGPVGIIYATKQMSELGLTYLIQFAAILSINLAIFNILPLPALDGGRILFVIIGKLKGTPVREIIEQRTHQIGFILLLLLMIVVTARDFSNFHILDKIVILFR
ncbi:MAG TPA: RIP metalloprotease RseP [Candidatus Fimivivens sp.]|nr:RIP metalloprotease RseP [Candidatus Fimivivens sp.]